jgi:hypothetical protein
MKKAAAGRFFVDNDNLAIRDYFSSLYGNCLITTHPGLFLTETSGSTEACVLGFCKRKALQDLPEI